MRVAMQTLAEQGHLDYGAFVRAAQVNGLMADHLVDGEPYLACNAVLLQAEEAALLRDLSEAFAAALVKAACALQADVPALVELGFPWVAAELLSAETARTPVVGRFDYVCDHAGCWWLLEFNADTPSGLRETAAVDPLVAIHLGCTAAVEQPNAAFGARLGRAFSHALVGLAPGAVLGLVMNAGELEDLAQLAFVERLLKPLLRDRGVEVVLGDVHNFGIKGRRATLCGRPLDALYRCLPFETTFGTAQFAALFEAMAAGRLLVLNGLFGLLLQHKGLLAWLWAQRDSTLFTPTERRAIAEHLPPTYVITDLPFQRNDVVLKQYFGREGAEVYFGDQLDAAAWQELRARRTYIAQGRVAVAPLPAVVPTSLGPIKQAGHAVVGGFVLNGEFGGFYTRFGGPITTSHAKWMATYVEAPWLAGPVAAGVVHKH